MEMMLILPPAFMVNELTVAVPTVWLPLTATLALILMGR